MDLTITDVSILAPAAVLILWSVFVLFWMVATRFVAFKKAGIDPATAKPGGRYQDLEPGLPPSVNWKSHNYTHLMEQPTLFYATLIILCLTGEGSGINLALAWAYVVLRVIHSLWQSIVNTLPTRIALFATSTTCLAILAINAVGATVL